MLQVAAAVLHLEEAHPMTGRGQDQDPPSSVPIVEIPLLSSNSLVSFVSPDNVSCRFVRSQGSTVAQLI